MSIAPAVVRDGRATVLRADRDGIATAARLLRAGRLVAFGTETVYGLGALATDADAAAAVFAAKGRPASNPLICHVADAEAAFAIGVASTPARQLADRFWPGPLTLVLPHRAGAAIARPVRAGGDTVALRIPRGDAALALLRAVGGPVAAPSANRSGRLSPTSAADVLAELGDRIDAVLDTGPCPVGVESTVVDLAGPADGPARLLRPGGVSRDALEAVIGPVMAAGDADHALPRSPGLLPSHYAPALPLRLDATVLAPGEALLGFGPDLPAAPLAVNLSARGDLAEAASNLFGALRFLDAEASRMKLGLIAVSPVPAGGLGDAIRDRLRRAAAPRPG